MKFIAALLVPFILSTPALCLRVKLANVGTMSFDCNIMPEVCSNMCFGVHCRGGRYGKTFTYDPNGAIDARRRAAGCGPNNRCSKAPWGGRNLSCDEFPFANTREADLGGQNNRCVPAVQNNRQGGTISAWIQAKTNFIKNQPPFLYNIVFTSANKLQYCFDRGAGTCDADANQWEGRRKAPNGGKWVTPFRRREADLVPSTFNQYMSKRGEFITSARRMEVGEKLHHVRLDPVAEAAALEIKDEDARNAFYANPDNYELIEDEVERPVTPEEAATLP